MMMTGNFLKQVILRLDFAGEINRSQQILDEIKRAVSDVLPEFETRDVVSVEMTIDQTQKTTKEKRFKSFILRNNATNNSLVLEPTAIIFDLKKYNSYEELKGLVHKVIPNLGEQNQYIKVSKIGLRYINQIIIGEGNPFDWTELIKEPLMCSLGFIEDRNELSRSVGVIEINKSDYYVKFQYGWFNSEFPNPIAKKEFLLDYDCYSKNETDISFIFSQIEILHEEIKELFERSTYIENLQTYGR
ncbi:MAG: TIGR04255 family protein [Euryarchaeota archaeon]|nr:TIGR04255 family protein [Euryarchaeota archaeon]